MNFFNRLKLLQDHNMKLDINIMFLQSTSSTIKPAVSNDNAETLYVHTVENVLCDLFDFHTYRPWEFNSSFPVRCISFPYITVGLPLIIFNKLLSIVEETITDNPYLLLVIPRLVMAMLSLIHDWCLCNICKMFEQNYVHSLVTFSTSYVTFVFYTRTFSNSLESILFSLLLLVVCKVIYHLSLNNKDDVQQPCYGKYKNNLPFNYAVGFLVALGFYNRPTFVLFAAIPVLFWLQINIELDMKSNLIMFRRFISLIPSFALTCFVLALFDSLYYLNISLFDMLVNIMEGQTMLLNNLIYTPLNFIHYNLDSSNLAMHGVHPRYLHLLVNIPLLYGIIGVYGIFYYIQIILDVTRRQQIILIPHSAMMIVSFILPVLALSAFPHQEPRFLIPLLLPLSFMFSDWICGHSTKKRVIFILWCIYNLVCGIFFGFLHQGGIVPSLISLNKRLMENREIEVNTHIIYYHTYMPPRHLLSLKSAVPVKIHDLSGSNEYAFENILNEILLNKNQKIIYIVIPNDTGNKLLDSSTALLQQNYTLLQQFFPHFSSEDPPDILSAFYENQNHLTFIEQLCNSLSLNLYQINHGNDMPLNKF